MNIGQKLKCHGWTWQRVKLSDNRLLSNPVWNQAMISDAEHSLTGYFCGYATVYDYSDGSDEVGAHPNVIVKFETYDKVTWELVDPKWIEVDND